MVEFALILPVFLLILLALFDGGRLIFQNNQLTNIARTAARATAVRDWPSPLCDGLYVKLDCVERIVAQQAIAMSEIPTVTLAQCDVEPCKIGSPYTVSIHSQVTFITPIISAVLGPRDIDGQTTMPIESLRAP